MLEHKSLSFKTEEKARDFISNSKDISIPILYKAVDREKWLVVYSIEKGE